MIGSYRRYVGPRFSRGNWFGPRFFRGYRRPGYYRFGGHFQQPTAEQQALRSTVAEVARLFVFAARSTYGDAEKQAQLLALLERFRNELSEFIPGSSQHPQQANPENAPQVEQA